MKSVFIYSLFCEYIYLEYERIRVMHRVNRAENVMRVLVKQSTGHTHTGHTDREDTPDTGTHTRTTRPPNEHLPQALNNAQRWREDLRHRSTYIYIEHVGL